jgi:hypothetical protein
MLFFQQDSTTAHTPKASMDDMKEVFVDIVISSGLWQAHSSNLKPIWFHLWKSVKQNVSRSKPHTIVEMKEKI